MSRNPCVQVALTYVRHASSSARIGFLIVAGFLFPAFVLTTAITEHLELFVIMACVMYRPIAVHVKSQFADARSCLIPGFRRPHIVVAAVAAFAITVLLPATCALVAGSHSVGLVALMVFLFGFILWSELLDSPWLRFCLGFVWLPVVIEPGRTFMRELTSDEFEVQAAALLVTGMAITLLGGFHLVHINEETSGYRRRPQAGWAPEGRTTKESDTEESALFPSLNSWSNERRAVRLVRHARRAHTSLWSRVCRWQMETVTGWSVFLWSLGVVLYLMFIGWNEGPKPPDATILFLALTFVPAFKLMGDWSRQTRALSHEVLMPVRRATYLQQLGGAFFLSQLYLWAAISTATILWWMIASGQRPDPVVIVNLMVVSGFFQVFLFGVFVWLVQCGSLLLGVVVGGTAVLAPMVLMSLPGRPLLTEWRSSTMLVMVILAAIGLTFAYVAYRRWLVADFD